jgi:hypothetical protein
MMTPVLFALLGTLSLPAQVPVTRAPDALPASPTVECDSVRNRAAFEREFRERLEKLVREQLALNDDKMRQLREVTNKFQPEHKALADREFALAAELKKETAREETANQSRISEILDEMFDLRLEREMVVRAEQRDLARYFTPWQRAKYLGIQFRLWGTLMMERARPAAASSTSR